MGEKVLTHEELRDSRKGLQILVREKLKLKKARQFVRSCRGDSQDSHNEASADSPFPCDDDNNSELLGDLTGNGDEDDIEQSKGKAGASLPFSERKLSLKFCSQFHHLTSWPFKSILLIRQIPTLHF